jgi:hypothetical protein
MVDDGGFTGFSMSEVLKLRGFEWVLKLSVELRLSSLIRNLIIDLMLKAFFVREMDVMYSLVGIMSDTVSHGITR